MSAPASRIRGDAPERTDLDRNAFCVLEATTRDDRRRIVELAEERGLVIDSELCAKARSDLITPRTRLSAEIAWLPGVSPQRAKDLLRGLRTHIDLLKGEGAIPELAHANLIAAALELLDPDMEAGAWCGWITMLARVVESIDAEGVQRDINEDRLVAGLPEVKALDVVEAELAERRRYYRKAIKSALDNLPSEKLVEVVTMIVRSTTNWGEKHAPLLIDELVDSYQADAGGVLQKGADNIDKIIEAAKAAGPAGVASVRPLIDSLEGALRKWNKLAKPIQVSMKARGLDHDASRKLAIRIRNLGVDLFKEHDMTEVAERLTAMIGDIFADLPEIKDQATEDIKQLQELANNRLEEQKNREQWARDITFEAEVGFVFKDKLRISPQGLQWKNKIYPLESVTRVRWGGIRNSSGTSYKIAFGDSRTEALIELKRLETYQEFTKRLWDAVCTRLMVDMIAALKAGKRLAFGDAVLDDLGVQLTKHKFIGSEAVYVGWGETNVWSANGSFFIGAKADEKLYGEMSYIESANVHVCEAVIRAAFRKGAVPLSNLLK